MTKEELAEIGKRLRKRRNELGLTREKMAELADISSGYYAQLEVGTSQMSIGTLIKLSESMLLSTDYILFDKERKPGDPSDVFGLLSDCTERELKLAKEVLMLFLMKNDSASAEEDGQ